MLKQRLQEDLKKSLENLGFETSSDVVLSIPKNPSFGDYSTNIALQLSKNYITENKQSVMEIATKISENLQNLDYLEKVEVALPGFINFSFKNDALMENLHKTCDYSSLVVPKIDLGNEKIKVMVEYTDPNPFKEFHIGHLFTNTIGEALSRLIEATGAEVKRADYFGDVGLNVAKSMYGMKRKLEDEKLTLKDLDKKSLSEKVDFLGKAYVVGATAYDQNEEAQAEIKNINFLVYVGVQQYMKDTFGFQPQVKYEAYAEIDQEKLDEVMELYQKGRGWSLAAFEEIYEKVGTKFDYYYAESIIGEYGLPIVKDYLKKGVFVEDQGAVIFPGEKYGLHNRVFINSQGLPTYEAKEIGLAFKKYEDFKYDKSIVVTGNEIKEYYQVLMMALSQIDPELAKKITHVPHGMLRMVGGKMSSRKGNVLTFDWLFNEVQQRVEKIMQDSDLEKEEKSRVVEMVTISAIKFSMLKSAPSMNITFDLEKSVSFEGDSGPYVQYTYTRAKSVLRNAAYNYLPTEIKHNLEKEERELLRHIEYFHGQIEEAADHLHPQVVATYLLELSKAFNLFYQKHPIIKSGEEKVAFRLALTCAIAVILKQGLYLLGIEAPERM